MPASQELEPEKRPWEAPTIEELDFKTTEASYGIPGVVEFGLYTT